MMPESMSLLVTRSTRTYVKDLAERVVWTFLEGFLGGVAITQLTDQGMWIAAATAGATAVFALLKGLAARGMGDKNSASTVSGV